MRTLSNRCRLITDEAFLILHEIGIAVLPPLGCIAVFSTCYHTQSSEIDHRGVPVSVVPRVVLQSDLRHCQSQDKLPLGCAQNEEYEALSKDTRNMTVSASIHT